MEKETETSDLTLRNDGGPLSWHGAGALASIFPNAEGVKIGQRTWGPFSREQVFTSCAVRVDRAKESEKEVKTTTVLYPSDGKFNFPLDRGMQFY